MTIRDVMTPDVETCGPDTDLATVVRMMWDRDCGFIPVVNASGTLSGVVTDRDICITSATRHVLPEDMPARQAMTHPVHACLPDDDVTDALATMKQYKVRRMPVIDSNGSVRGVISMNDIVLASARGLGPDSKEKSLSPFATSPRRKVDDDGLVFDVDGIEVHAVREDNAYGGIRAVLQARLAEARIHGRSRSRERAADVVAAGLADAVVVRP